MPSRLPQPKSASAWLLLLGAGLSLFTIGSTEVVGIAIFLLLAGVGMVLARPTVAPAGGPSILAALFVLSCLTALLPYSWFGGSQWRTLFSDHGPVQLANSVAAMPAHGWFWWSMLLASLAIGLALLSQPRRGSALALFLLAVVGVSALYALLSIVVAQSDWSPAISSSQASFGFLVNRNNTSTLLVVGAVLSFGLMQAEIARGRSGTAVVAALCAAPQVVALLFYSPSRGGVVFLALGLLIWVFGAINRHNRRRLGLTLAVVLVFLVGLFFSGSNPARDRFDRVYEKARGAEISEDASSPVDFRLPVARDVLGILADVPLTGVGLGQLEYIFPQYRKETVNTSYVIHPESDWLQVAAESGLPALVILLLLSGWVFLLFWKARHGSDGMLRWSAVSALAAGMAHGLVDVPWHLLAVGWFFLIILGVALPPSTRKLRRLWIPRTACIVAGILLFSGGLFLLQTRGTTEVPLPFRWRVYNQEMPLLMESGQWDEAEVMARQALADFPLKFEAHYWLAALLNNFLETEEEVDALLAAARQVEPVVPQVGVSQAAVWQHVDASREAEAWSEAVRRSVLLDRKAGLEELPSATNQVRSAMGAGRPRPAMQLALKNYLRDEPLLLAAWLQGANAAMAAEFWQTLPDSSAFLDRLPEKVRFTLLRRWIASPDPAPAAAYMEARQAEALPPGLYWRLLARFYASRGEYEAAVRLVATSLDLPLDQWEEGEFSRRILRLRGERNNVAVERLLGEALKKRPPKGPELVTVMGFHAASGEWKISWQAASRLAAAKKIRQ